MRRHQRLLLLDYGGVVAVDHIRDREEALAEALGGVPVETLPSVLGENSQLGFQFRRGDLSEDDFWSAVHVRIGTDQRTSGASLSALWANTYLPRSDVLETIALRSDVILTGLITNTDRGRFRSMSRNPLVTNNFDFLFASFAVCAVKQERRFWESVSAILLTHGASARVSYLDDRPAHVDAASQQGWHSSLFNGIDSIQDALAYLDG